MDNLAKVWPDVQNFVFFLGPRCCCCLSMFFVRNVIFSTFLGRKMTTKWWLGRISREKKEIGLGRFQRKFYTDMWWKNITAHLCSSLFLQKNSGSESQILITILAWFNTAISHCHAWHLPIIKILNRNFFKGSYK